jgi:hypothetical protein
VSCTGDRGDGPADGGQGLGAIERRLADDDPALAAAFQRWHMPDETPAAQDGDMAVAPWVLAVFVVAAVSWVASTSFGILVAVVAVAWVLVDADQHRGGRRGAGRERLADRGAGLGSRGVDGRDDGGLPPTWRGGWM